MIRSIIIITLSVSLLQGCTLREKELELQKRETELNQREQDLLVRENNLKLREDELANKLKADSLATDSSFYNPVLTGTWQTQMVCTETTCTGSAVGDSRTESWQISYEGENVVAKALDNNTIVRVYTGHFTGNTLELIDERPATGTAPATKMVVRLRMINDKSMEGQREIIRTDCKIVYSLNLTKQTT